MKKMFWIAIIAAFPLLAHADSCENLIALSKNKYSISSDKSDIEQAAAQFCSEYSSSSGSTKSRSFGASYKLLSASFGSSNVSVEQVASRYCSASSNYSQSKDAYKQFVELIAPNAYGAYEECLRMSKLDVTFVLDIQTILPDEFAMTTSFSSSTKQDNDATIRASSSSDIACSWDEGTTTTVTLTTGTSAVLHCKRSDQTKAGYVVVARTDGAKGSMSIPWRAYSREGIPVDTINEMETRMIGMENQLGQAMAGLKQTMDTAHRFESAATVDLYQCPDGKTPGANPKGGAWGFYGCRGQYTSRSTCDNIEWPWHELRNCTRLGRLRYY